MISIDWRINSIDDNLGGKEKVDQYDQETSFLVHVIVQGKWFFRKWGEINQFDVIKWIYNYGLVG